MDFLGIGVPELLVITLILLLILGPTELVTLGRKSGQLIRRIRQSDTWRMVSNLAQALRNLPTALADETRAEEIFANVVPKTDRRTTTPTEAEGENTIGGPELKRREERDGYSTWVTPPAPEPPPSGETEAAAGDGE
jgi:Sec-independent protein translocase protein TatA